MRRIHRLRADSLIAEPVAYTNAVGDVVYQPALQNGVRLWLEPGWEGGYHVWINKEATEKAEAERRHTKSRPTPYRPTEHLKPVLTTRKHALSLARREARRKYLSKNFHQYEEIQK